MQVLNDASLATADGVGILMAARWLGTPIRERVTGVALVERIAKQAAIRGWRIFFLGAAPGVAEKAAQVLRHRYAGLQIAGAYAGSPSIIEEPFVRQQVLDANPDILLVAYGHPAQDLWIARNQALLNVRLAIGVGGTFDEIVGLVPHAPAWMHRVGLKWLWRLIQQPWRYKRIYTAVVQFPLAILLRRASAPPNDAK
jgi:N-acetylglucosaminyldiphosphoundecaprenol N-acetyl-beta-D-mannosaminyltransferase